MLLLCGVFLHPGKTVIHRGRKQKDGHLIGVFFMQAVTLQISRNVTERYSFWSSYINTSVGVHCRTSASHTHTHRGQTCCTGKGFVLPNTCGCSGIHGQHLISPHARRRLVTKRRQLNKGGWLTGNVTTRRLGRGRSGLMII